MKRILHTSSSPLAGLVLAASVACTPVEVPERRAASESVRERAEPAAPAVTQEVGPAALPASAVARTPAIPLYDARRAPEASLHTVADTPLAPDPSARGPAGKTTAPANVTLTSSAKVGSVELTLAIEVTRDIPRVVARFVLPEGVELLAGKLEEDFGARSRGELSELRVTVFVPNQGTFRVAAGADLHQSRGVKLHKGDVLHLGEGAP